MNPRGEEREMSIVLCDNFLLSFVVSQADGCLFLFFFWRKRRRRLCVRATYQVQYLPGALVTLAAIVSNFAIDKCPLSFETNS